MKIQVFARSISSLLVAAVLLSSNLALATATAQFIPPPPPDQGYPPGSLRGGASRGDCPTVESQLTALAPSIETAASGAEMESVWGLTTADRPTFWFYIPYALTENYPGEFVLLDADRKYVYQSPPIRSSEAGIIQITLPPTIRSLEVGKLYHWAFMIRCEADNPIFAQGSIERIVPASTLTDQLAQLTPDERAALFANQGIWYDALTTLAKLRLADPNDQAVVASWNSLMQSVGLADIAGQPILNCCSPSQLHSAGAIAN